MSIQVQYYDTVAHGYTGILTGNKSVLVTSSTGVPSFSTVLPAPLTINENTALPGGGSGFQIQVAGGDGLGCFTTFDAFASNTGFYLRRSNGTAAVPTKLLSGQETGSIVGQGYGATDFAPATTRIVFVATQDFSDTVAGSKITFEATAIGGARSVIGAMSPDTGCVLSGTPTNDSAAAGKIGEYVSSNLLVGSAVALTTATSKTVTSISLTAGDWDVTGTVAFAPAAGTLIVDMKGGISQTNNTLATLSDTAALVDIPLSPSAGVGATIPVGTSRISLSGTTTIYLVAQCTFTVSTNAAYGFISARRAR